MKKALFVLPEVVSDVVLIPSVDSDRDYRFSDRAEEDDYGDLNEQREAIMARMRSSVIWFLGGR